MTHTSASQDNHRSALFCALPPEKLDTAFTVTPQVPVSLIPRCICLLSYLSCIQKWTMNHTNSLKNNSSSSIRPSWPRIIHTTIYLVHYNLAIWLPFPPARKVFVQFFSFFQSQSRVSPSQRSLCHDLKIVTWKRVLFSPQVHWFLTPATYLCPLGHLHILLFCFCFSFVCLLFLPFLLHETI